MTARRLTGWAGTAASVADVRPLGEGIDAVPWRAVGARGLVARGFGRSYGDAAQNGGGIVIDTTLTASLPTEPPDGDGWVRVEAGLSLARLAAWAAAHGLRLPVEPGTGQVSVGGAIAADVHGKGHRHDGSFGAWLRSVTVDTPGAGQLVLRSGEPEFDATVGGLGLTGVVVEAELQLVPAASSAVVVDSAATAGLDESLAALADAAEEHRFAAAWVDLMAPGRQFGRGIVEGADPASVGELTGPWLDDPHRSARRRPPRALVALPARAFSPGVARLANAARFHAHRPALGEVGPAEAFHRPLDAVQEWNRLYGRRGLVQYQVALPDGPALQRLVRHLADHDAPSVLAVIKRFGGAGRGMLSFPMPGWTLAVDFPAVARLGPLLDRCDDIVAEAGGRVYLAKDSRLNRRHLAAMYPRLDEWRSVRGRLDPAGRLASDLDRRLDLTDRRH